VVNATVQTEAINETLGVNLPVDRGQTLGGFLFHVAGHLPQRGETLSWEEWEFTVQVIRRRRIAVVRMRRRQES
jgi:CBS domain containing-hemolysin-like protein